MPDNTQDYALVVGIDDYPEYTALKGAKNDAQRFADWLKDKTTGGGLPDDHCKCVLSTSSPCSPTWDQVNSKLLEIHTQAQVTGKRRFYFYFSGHGQTSTSSEVNLCLAQWTDQPHGLRMALSYADWRTAIVDCTGFTEIFFLLDCCRTRIHGGGGLPPSLACAKPDSSATQAKTFIGYATEFQNQAFEAETQTDQSGQPVYGGHFTEALLTGLRGGAAVAGGGVTPSKLKTYLEQWTPRLAKDADDPEQNAVVEDGLPSYPTQPMLGSAALTGTLKVELGAGRSGPVRLFAPDDSLVHEAGSDTSPWEFNDLRYGKYRLLDTVSQDEKTFDFQPRQPLMSVMFE